MLKGVSTQSHQVSGSESPLACATNNASVAGLHKAIIDALPGAVLLLDKHGIVISANPNAGDWLGLPIVGEAWRDIAKRAFDSDLNKGELVTRDHRLLNISTQPLGGAPGQIVLLSDVTETRAQQELSERNARLASIGEMMARLSHQIRTPIATAMLYLSQLQTGANSNEQHAGFADKSLRRLRHVERMIRDMLMFAHGGQMTKEPVASSLLVEDLESQLAPLVESIGAAYTIECETDCAVNANRVGVVTALLNICCNAIEIVGDSLSLNIRMREAQGNLVFDISDNGPGIDPRLHDKIFQPFITSRNSGTGLGLSVVRSVFEAHGGRADVRASASGGAHFSVCIPLGVAEQSRVDARAVA
ncbi:MAG: ATP-binding protein [Pseudomonadota bacterium]